LKELTEFRQEEHEGHEGGGGEIFDGINGILTKLTEWEAGKFGVIAGFTQNEFVVMGWRNNGAMALLEEG
jgi:hypothetical protein